jgi:hypothetical protein
MVIGGVLLIIGVILLIFGLGSQEWISQERSHGISTGNYQFWNAMETTRVYSLPVSIVLLLVGGVLFFSQLAFPSDKTKKSTVTVSPSLEKHQFIGTWKEGNATFIFFSDGTGSMPEGVSITWDIKDGKLVITTSNQVSASTYAYSYSFSDNDTSLSLTSTYENLNLTKQ